MADSDSESSTDEVTELFKKMTIADNVNFKWSGTLVELKSFIGNLLCTDCGNENYAKGSFKCTPLSLRVTLYNDQIVLFQGEDAENIKQLISSYYNDEAYHHYFGCCPIYEKEYNHIIRRVDENPILGYPYQFCAAFFHTHRWWVGNREREHQCLDERRCIISKRALDEGFRVQPKTAVAVVKFKNNKNKVVYEAKYTNCVSEQKHAEDFFKDDVEGELKKKIKDNRNGTITMYLTLPPCNESVSIEGTEGTPVNKSCCDTLKKMYNKTLKKNEIKLHIKVTHPYRLSTFEAKREPFKTLGKNAMKGIEDLMVAGIGFSAMNEEDWDYLSSMTIHIMKPRDELDQEIEKIVEHIRTKTKRKTSRKKRN